MPILYIEYAISIEFQRMAFGAKRHDTNFKWRILNVPTKISISICMKMYKMENGFSASPYAPWIHDMSV